jgi:hypothetical protein
MTDPPAAPHRLDSWKMIAKYLDRDLATVRRWEKSLGLPVYRVGGSGRSVFANASEIDTWLERARPASAVPDHRAGPAVGAIPAHPARTIWARVSSVTLRAALVLALVVAVFIASLYARAGAMAGGELHAEVTSGALIARDGAGRERWRHGFSDRYTIATPRAPVQVTGGTAPGVYFATSYRTGHGQDDVGSGVLSLFDMAGRSQRVFSFDDRVTFSHVTYDAPWAITAFAVNEADGSYRVAVSAHHYTWDPGLVTILDREWRRLGTFVHAGWIEQVRWLSADRLLIGGFSNAYDGGMVALLDTAAMEGQGPTPAGSRHGCESCGGGGPLRMFVFPRSELNRVSASPFNRVILQTSKGHVTARTIEMAAARGDADAIYEFNASLDMVSARFSERYWELHRGLEADGRIAHRRDQCPDRDGPRQVLMWEPAGGWRDVLIR